MYQSRLAEMDEEGWHQRNGVHDYNRYLFDVRTDNMEEFTYITRNEFTTSSITPGEQQEEMSTNLMLSGMILIIEQYT